MQHQEQQQPPEQKYPGADTRVTPQELTSALSAIYDRHEAETRHRMATVSITDDVLELIPEVSPEEIVAAVESRRRSLRRRRAWQRTFAAAGVGLIIACSLVSYRLSAEAPLKDWTKESLAEVGQQILVENHPGTTKLLRTLTEVPDADPVHCNADELVILAEYVNRLTSDGSKQRLSYMNIYHETMPWIIVKHDNAVYLRGWIATKLTAKAVRLSGVLLYDTPDAPELSAHPVPITFRVTARLLDPPCIEHQEVLHRGERLTISNVVLDEHAWEKW